MSNCFLETITGHGWSRVIDDKDKLHIGPHGSTWRKGPVRIEMTGAELAIHNGAVCYYVCFETVWVLSAIVVDAHARGMLYGQLAMLDLIDMAKELKCKKISLECAPIHHSHLKEKALKEKDKEELRQRLLSWYRGLGFKARTEPAYPIIMDIEFNHGE